MTPKHTLIYPPKQDAGRAQSRPPGVTIGGPVPNGPRSQARASSGPYPASLTAFPLEEDPRPSRAEAGKSPRLPRFQDLPKTNTSGLIPRFFKFPGYNSSGILSLVEITSRSGLRSDCGSFQKLPGPPRGPGFGKTCASLVCVRPPQGGPIGCFPPHAPLEGSFHVWPCAVGFVPKSTTRALSPPDRSFLLVDEGTFLVKTSSLGCDMPDRDSRLRK